MFLKKRDEGVTTASGSMRGVPLYYEPACLRACTRKEHPSHAHPHPACKSAHTHVRRVRVRTHADVCACLLGAESRKLLVHSSHAQEHKGDLGGRGALSEQLLQRIIELEDENRALRSDLVTLRCGSVRVCTAAQAV